MSFSKPLSLFLTSSSLKCLTCFECTPQVSHCIFNFFERKIFQISSFMQCFWYLVLVFSRSYLSYVYWLSLYNFLLTSIFSCHLQHITLHNLNQVALSIHYAFFYKLFLTPKFIEFFHQLIVIYIFPNCCFIYY